MASNLDAAIDSIESYKRANPSARKAQVQHAYIKRFQPRKVRSVFVGRGYALRFSEARTDAFSNTVLSLSALKGHDNRPFVVVVIREQHVSFLLANTTLLRKISHNSHRLRVDNVRGSFNGTDILSEYEAIANIPENFEQLFAIHSAFTWLENLERLVEATNAIIGRDNRFHPTDAQRWTILEAPERAATALSSAAFCAVKQELVAVIHRECGAILGAARTENVNLRGNAIEQIITGVQSAHELGDLSCDLGDDTLLLIDVKTKLLDRASAPKAYNIDKMLAFLAEPSSVFAFLIVGVNVGAETVCGKLLPSLDNAVLDATVVQHHWAGRGSRGVTQLSGRLGHANNPGYTPIISLQRARQFLEQLLDL
ncbi:MAG: hypothetical protein ACRDFQ_04050 [Anaerolineales bacterium]